MQIDITKLLSNYAYSIDIKSDVKIPEELIKDVRVVELKELEFNGKSSLDEDDNVLVTGKIKGKMLLRDDLTLEEVEYPLDVEVEEIFENKQNILDITDVLWQNILVEIPSKVRKTDEDITLEGDGWRVISEEKFNEERNKANNPFSNLGELLKTKEDE